MDGSAARKMEAAQYRDLDYSRHRLSTSSEERTIFYIDDMSPPPLEVVSPTSSAGSRRLCEPPDINLMLQQQQHQQQQQQQYSPTQQQQQQMMHRFSPQQLPPELLHHQRRRNSSSQCGPGLINDRPRPRRQRRQSEFSFEHSGRRASSGRVRANSIARPTPLGDGRRASVVKKSSVSGGVPGTRSRRASNAAHRRDSIRPAKSEGTRSPSVLLTPTSAELEMIKDPRVLEQARRHRRVAMIVLGTFFFILTAAVLAVIVTLTHSSFHAPPIGSSELAEHRANSARKTRSC